MSVFGGDSWAREAQQRKRRLDDLMLPASSSSLSASGSFKRLSNGKFACLVCPHRPVLDSPLMLSLHNKGSRHIAVESRLRENELSRQQVINKRLALSSEASLSNSGKPHPGGRTSGWKMLCPVDLKFPLLIFQWKIGPEILVLLTLAIVKNRHSLVIKLEARCFQMGRLISGNARSKNSGSLPQVGNGMAMEDGTEMKMLNLIQTKMILTSASVNQLRNSGPLAATFVLFNLQNRFVIPKPDRNRSSPLKILLHVHGVNHVNFLLSIMSKCLTD